MEEGEGALDRGLCAGHQDGAEYGEDRREGGREGGRGVQGREGRESKMTGLRWRTRWREREGGRKEGREGGRLSMTLIHYWSNPHSS